jgi:hypothetical protein
MVPINISLFVFTGRKEALLIWEKLNGETQSGVWKLGAPECGRVELFIYM